jgi:hypothetical protein
MQFFPVVEFVVWTVFLIWAVRQSFDDQLYLSVVIIGIIALVLIIFGFFVVKDFAAGLILKTEYHLKAGEILHIKNAKGKISHLGYLYLELETHEMEKIKIPYSKISGTELSLPAAESGMKKFSQTLAVEKKYDLFTTKQKIKNTILNSPYSSITHVPEINLTGEDADWYDFSIYFQAYNEDHALKIKEMLKSKTN